MHCAFLGSLLLIQLIILLTSKKCAIYASHPQEACSSTTSSISSAVNNRKATGNMSSTNVVGNNGGGGGNVALGWDLLRDPFRNKGLASSAEEREKHHTRGLLPAGIVPLEVQVATALKQVRDRPTPMDKFLFLDHVRDANVQVRLLRVPGRHACPPLSLSPDPMCWGQRAVLTQISFLRRSHSFSMPCSSRTWRSSCPTCTLPLSGLLVWLSPTSSPPAPRAYSSPCPIKVASFRF